MERDYNLRGVGRDIHYSMEERTATADEREHFNLRGVESAIHYSMEERTVTTDKREHIIACLEGPLSHKGPKGTAEEEIRLLMIVNDVLLTCREGNKTKGLFPSSCRIYQPD